MERPTKKQHELLSFIDGFVKGNGYGPSYREIMRALDYKSVSTVATHVNGLIARGWLVKKDNSARSLEVVSLETAKPGVRAAKAVQEHKPVLQVLLDKIAEYDALEGESELSMAERDTLVESLRILGFEDAYESYKDNQNQI